MQLHNLFSGLSCTSGILGLADFAGAIEWKTGYIASLTLLVLCILSGIWSLKESGAFKNPRRNCKQRTGKRN